MFIIWGSKWREERVESRFLTCPVCNDGREFDVIEAQKYFTLFFIPLFSYGKIVELLECPECKSTFKPDAFNPQKAVDYFIKEQWRNL